MKLYINEELLEYLADEFLKSEEKNKKKTTFLAYFESRKKELESKVSKK